MPMRTWRGVITIYLVTLAVFGLYMAYVAPLKAFLAPDIYLDLRDGGYDLPAALAFYERLGSLGRGFYMRSTLFDTIWPLLLALSGFLMARMTFRRWWLVAGFAAGPDAFGLLDLLENVGLIVMNWRFPHITSGLVAYSNALTLTKLATIPVAFGAFFVTPAIALALAAMRRAGGGATGAD